MLRHLIGDVLRRLALINLRRADEIIERAKRRATAHNKRAQWLNDAREWLLIGGDWQEIRRRHAQHGKRQTASARAL